MFPLPSTFTVSWTDSFIWADVLSTSAEISNLPTAPANPSGAGRRQRLYLYGYGGTLHDDGLIRLAVRHRESCGFYLYSPDDAGKQDRSQFIHCVQVGVDSLSVLILPLSPSRSKSRQSREAW